MARLPTPAWGVIRAQSWCGASGATSRGRGGAAGHAGGVPVTGVTGPVEQSGGRGRGAPGRGVGTRRGGRAGRGWPGVGGLSPHGPEQAAAADAFQRPLRSRFQARLSRSVRLLQKTQAEINHRV